jgi:cob(I)alamin adenosyltransferase
MKILGPRRDDTEIELDPTRAYRRGRVLDAMLRAALPRPRRGVHRGTSEALARMDEARMVDAARRVEEA